MLRIPVERSVFPRVKAYGKISKAGVIRVSIRRQQSITRPTLRLRLNSTSTPTVPPRLVQMNQFRCWKQCPVSPSVSNSTILQTTTRLGSASIQRAHPTRIMGRRINGGSTSGTSTRTTYRYQTGGGLKAIGTFVSSQTADTHWSNEKISPSTRRTTSHTASPPSLRQLRLVTIQLRLLRLNRLMRRLKSQGAEE